MMNNKHKTNGTHHMLHESQYQMDHDNQTESTKKKICYYPKYTNYMTNQNNGLSNDKIKGQNNIIAQDTLNQIGKNKLDRRNVVHCFKEKNGIQKNLKINNEISNKNAPFINSQNISANIQPNNIVHSTIEVTKKKKQVINKLSKEKIIHPIRTNYGALEQKQTIMKGNKAVIKIKTANNLDQLFCGEQFDVKPIQKKKLIPEKKGGQKAPKFLFINPINDKINEDKSFSDVKQIKQFQIAYSSILQQGQAQIRAFFQIRQEYYSVDPIYLEKHQQFIDWKVRAIVVNWMRHVSYEFEMKRDTYHLAVSLLDGYMSRSFGIAKSLVQSLGATTMFIASKLEQYESKSSHDFAETTNGCCSTRDIKELEINICKIMKFYLNVPTLSSLANQMMLQWDLYITQNYEAIHHVCFLNCKTKPLFKKLDQASYRLYRQLMQFIDCSILDIQTAQFKPKLLISSFMYLLLGQQLGYFYNPKQIVEQFPRSSLYMLNDNSNFNQIYGSFVIFCFGLQLIDLLPTVQYCSTYFQLHMTYQKPMLSDEKLQIMKWQEYCSYQTYNKQMLKTVFNRYRNIYV